MPADRFVEKFTAIFFGIPEMFRHRREGNVFFVVVFYIVYKIHRYVFGVRYDGIFETVRFENNVEKFVCISAIEKKRFVRFVIPFFYDARYFFVIVGNGV
mgnify:CR=1 FL=1